MRACLPANLCRHTNVCMPVCARMRKLTHSPADLPSSSSSRSICSCLSPCLKPSPTVAIFPIVATTWLAFLVFLLPRKDMEARLGAVTALFLALAAIQFVITGDTPASSYITALQQLVLMSYCCLILASLLCSKPFGDCFPSCLPTWAANACAVLACACDCALHEA